MMNLTVPSNGYQIIGAEVSSPDNWLPRCTKRPSWPALDQYLWEEGCKPGDPFTPGGHGSKLRKDSRAKTIKGYGYWLSFLAANGWLDKSQHPAQRVTRERLMHYFKAMLARKLRGYAIMGRFMELRMAMKVMAPEHDTSFILRPNGVTIRGMLGPSCRPLKVPDAGVLYKWGISLMKRAKLDAPHRTGLVMYRDGLLIAMLAARGRRLRSMSLLRIGHEFIERDGTYRVELEPHQVKNNKHDMFNLPEKLTPFINQYLEHVRPALLRGRQSDALWIGKNGANLQAKGIQAMVCKRSKVRFGIAFGPHRFRHAIATTAVLRDPTAPNLGAAVLGNSAAVNEAHYIRADQVLAIRELQNIIEKSLDGIA
ncbi:MAG TPA: site-specific integrase [Acidocella sp.]|nr:site-specific integrase [Acidocella sp.]